VIVIAPDVSYGNAALTILLAVVEALPNIKFTAQQVIFRITLAP
jgi:hypothetical protein